jgi:N-methylhydantoinase A
MGGIRIGIDTGGTFTDVVALDEATGLVCTTKTPSTPADPSEGFLTGLAKVLATLGRTGTDVEGVAHGTTVATNALLEARIGPLGFVTTEGYKFVLEIARQSVPDGYGNSYFWVKPERIVPVHLVREVGGRLDHRGEEIRPFDEAGAAAAARWFREQGIDCVGVCFLHSYANPAHERRMRDVLAAEHPACVVSISSDVLREYREYERSVTTLVDAAVKPKVTRYLLGIAERLEAFSAGREGAPAPFHVMKSNGGVASAEEVVAQPITTVLSGPAAGALGAAMIATASGHDRVLTLDGGGTSTDVAVVLAGEPSLTTEGTVGAYPSKIPMIDVVTVGAGGGSIAWASPEGTLKVGPRSAGADPGPMCYGQGGEEPTVTDANLLLGRIPAQLLGGEIPLDFGAARAGFERLAGALALDVERCAEGVTEISAWNQANAIRRITVKRGLDVRDFTLVPFGGSGPLSTCRLLDVLGLHAALVPPDPGTTSAFGLLTVDVRGDYVQTAVARHHLLDLARVARIFDDLEARAAGALGREGFAPGARRFERSADLRYFGQAFEVRVAAPAGAVDAAFAGRVVDAFHDQHEALYGYCYRGERPGGSQERHPVEWVNLRVTGIGPIRKPQLPGLERGDGDAGRACTGTRQARFGAGVWHDTRLYARTGLRAGDVVTGPAVIEEFGSTLPVHPGYAARVDALGNLVVTKEAA